MTIYLAKLSWRDNFMPNQVLVQANSVENAVEKIHKRYKKEFSFCYIKSLEPLDIPINAIITDKQYISLG